MESLEELVDDHNQIKEPMGEYSLTETIPIGEDGDPSDVLLLQVQNTLGLSTRYSPLSHKRYKPPLEPTQIDLTDDHSQEELPITPNNAPKLYRPLPPKTTPKLYRMSPPEDKFSVKFARSGKIKRPKSAFFFFMAEIREKIMEKYEKLKSQGVLPYNAKLPELPRLPVSIYIYIYII